MFIAGVLLTAFALFIASKMGYATIEFHKKAEREPGSGSGGSGGSGPGGDSPDLRHK